jgi:predicted nuclease with TOPRIM domain
MDILSQVEEYRSKIESLAGIAAQAETALAELETIKGEKEALTLAVDKVSSENAELKEKILQLEGENEGLKADISKREEDKKASDEKALEIVASLGLKEIPVITITESNKPTAESIRAKYASLEGKEKAIFFKENQKALISGIVD